MLRLFVKLLGAMVSVGLLLGACGGDDNTADPTTADTEAEAAAPTATPAEPTPATTEEPTTPPADDTSGQVDAPQEPEPAPIVEEATTVPTVANDRCDMVPFSVWNSAEGGRAQFGELTQFLLETPTGNRSGSWECSKGVVMALVDGVPVIGALAGDPSRITIDGVDYLFNQAESSFQE